MGEPDNRFLRLMAMALWFGAGACGGVMILIALQTDFSAFDGQQTAQGTLMTSGH